MSETQESPVLTTEQQQRTHAVMTASQVLRDRTPGGMLVGETRNAKFPDIVELADYIVTGDVYMINLVRREQAEHPPVDFGVFGLGKDLFDRIFGDQPEPGDDIGLKGDGSADYDQPPLFDDEGTSRTVVHKVGCIFAARSEEHMGDCVLNTRPIKDQPQA